MTKRPALRLSPGIRWRATIKHALSHQSESCMQFISRRTVWMPTLWGWLLVFALVGAGVGVTFQYLHSFLAQRAPTDARVLVVEGWMDPRELDEVVRTVRISRYERILTTGGPLQGWTETGDSTYAERTARYLKRRLPERFVVAISSTDVARNRTYATAIAVRDWITRSNGTVTQLDVFSWGPHARRSRKVYQLALGPDVSVGVLHVPPSQYRPEAWWLSSAGTEAVVKEVIGLLWVSCCFWPDEA